ncbi:MAG: S8 family serine peptidase [Flavobacteriales bacterium]|nr:S8 family serine peptidase [Flavobacteriales bacterium]
MKSPNYIFPTLIILVSSFLILNGSNFTPVKASDGTYPGGRYFKMSPRVTEDDYKAKTVILKISDDHRVYCSPQQISIAPLRDLLKSIGSTGVKLMFPHSDRPEREKNKYGMKYADLSLIYEFKYTGDMSEVEVINRIYALGISEYVQPYYIHHEYFTPNDPQVGSQYHIGSVKAYQAWDIQKGDPNVTVAIVDSGSDTDHEDFVTQLKYNAGETLDGTDSDGDGYIDNNLGWDFVDEDNNTQMLGSNHGVHVAGCAVAATDNGVGISAPAFGCSYLPIKAGDGGTIGFGYPGITYAADHGASVINCSWGGPGGGQLGQDVIDYATINKDALVVAAAGNDNSEDLSYPCAYNGVLNVGSTASNDTKSGFSNFGYTVDLCAPGSNVWATDNNDGYTSMSGTSMASPVAAGCAALLRSEFPFLDALQTAEQLKVTCDNIYPVNNPAYADKLGAGRINLYNAVSGIALPSIVMTESNVTDKGDEAFVVGDTISIDGIFINFLAPAGPITATMTSQSANVQVVDGTTSLGSISAFGGSANNAADPFTIKILPGASLNEKVVLEIELTDGSYTTTVFFQVIVNVDYINVTINEVATSITSKSLTGFNDFSSQLEGLGFFILMTSQEQVTISCLTAVL